LVTSAGPGEGKSVTLANLAVVMAQAGRKVVAVDSDLRRPVLHKIFSLSNSHGLSDAILHANPSVSEHLQATEVENLWVLTSGPLPPNPAEFLGSERMGAVIDELQCQVDMVLLDTPPLLAVADAIILGNRLDGIVLVTDVGRTRRGDLQRVTKELNRVQVNLLGVVLNRLSPGSDHYYYYQSDNGQNEKGQRWLSRLQHRFWRREESGE
jgi:capsular exopolysaccharide synthesis family protein